MNIIEIIKNIFINNAFVMSFLFIALGVFVSSVISKYIFKGKLPSSAVAIIVGLIAAYIGGIITGGSNGIADIDVFTGIGILGGSSLRDFAIISTAYGASLSELKRSGLIGAVSLIVGVSFAFVLGTVFAVMFGYTDPVEITTIAAGTVTFITGAVTGSAVGASSDIIALAIAIGVVKSIVVMIATPLLAKAMRLDNFRSAMVYGGIMGTTSGVSAGLAATDQKLVPYGAMTATFFTGLACLLCPTVFYGLVNIAF
ncbi:possible malonate transporter [Firmicutes bacterium CAG:238]|jgi:malonate transporter MadM subunit|nr:possible malonate transporter [Firmicutes bacterium CAG:238]